MIPDERVAIHDVEGVRFGRFSGRIVTTCFVWRVADTLIDTGPPNQWRHVRRFAREQPLTRVIVTHHHEDHAGNLHRVHELGRVKTVAPRESLSFLSEGFPLQPYRQIVWGRPLPTLAEPMPNSMQLSDGTVLDPILLPGHSPDMTCLLDRRRRLLFAADLYVSRRIRYLRADEDLAEIMLSLDEALDLPFDTLLCSHRGIVSEGKKHLQEKLEYLLGLCKKAMHLAAKGGTVPEIARALLGPEDWVSRLSFGHFSKKNLIRECLRIGDNPPVTFD